MPLSKFAPNRHGMVLYSSQVGELHNVCTLLFEKQIEKSQVMYHYFKKSYVLFCYDYSSSSMDGEIRRHLLVTTEEELRVSVTQAIFYNNWSQPIEWAPTVH